MTRRQALAAGTSSLLLAGGLAACGNAKAPGQAAPAASVGKPKRGGVLHVGLLGAGAAELVSPSGANIANIMRTNLLYDPLFRLANDMRTPVPALALSAEPNSSATVWTFKLRPGVHFHDGKPMTAADVVHTIKSWRSPDSQTFGAYNSVIDFAKVRARGRLTVEVPLVRSVGNFPGLFNTDASTYIIPEGSTQKALERHPVGTGPYRFTSFDPGTQSVFARNDDYWQHGRPYVDKAVVTSSFTDDTARLNAFLAKDVDVLPFISPLQGKQVSQAATLLRSHSPNPYYFYVDVKRKPFTDVRVRQALRLLVDRQALIDGALAGYATVGNDLIGAEARFFASDLRRQQDVEQAKSLLKAAGQTGLTLTLQTANAFPGFNSSVTLFAAQAASAGVKIIPQVGNPAGYFNAGAGYPYAFGVSLLQPRADLNAYYSEAYAAFDESRAGLSSAMQGAIAAYPQTAARWRAVQEHEFNEGGHIVWANLDNIDALATGVHGVPASPVSPLNGWDLSGAWLS